jgi:energy-coupling factor transporter ATP-binding protein EcfA2
MSSETSLIADDGVEIPMFDKTYKSFLNKSIILYGSSGSGKSMIMRDLLYILKDYIPNVIVIAPTNNLNHSYDGIIPSQLIFNEVTEDLIKNIFNRQKGVVNIYNMINNLTKLENIYAKIAKSDDYIIRTKIENGYTNIKNKYDKNHSIHISEKKIKLQELDSLHKEKMKEFYKKVINKYRNQINSNIGHYKKILDDIELKIINFININPSMLLIIDDAAVSANIWCKYQEIKELFMNGRHWKMTFMISFQDDKLLDSSLRKNAFINIFTTETICNAYFNRTANNFTPQEKKKMAKIANFIFNDPKLKEKNYKKMVHIKDKVPSVYYTIADYIDDFKFGSSHLHDLCNKVKKNSEMTDNEFDEEIKAFLG